MSADSKKLLEERINMNKKRGFTLSEVLVTMGVIGVVAALTVPTLVNNYQRKAFAIQARKSVLDIENQVDMLITEEGKTSFGATSVSTTDGLDNFMKSHFKILKTCDSEHTSECFANQAYIAIEGNKTKNFTCAGTSYLLANSSVVCAQKISSQEVKPVEVEVETSGSTSIPSLDLLRPKDKYWQELRGLNIELYIDTNGQEGPNTGGRDMFHMYIQPDGRIYDEAVASGLICRAPGGDMSKAVCLQGIAIEKVVKDCKTSPVGDGCIETLSKNNWEMNY